MELYLPYVIGSSVSVIIGNVAYSYLSNDSTQHTTTQSQSTSQSQHTLLNDTTIEYNLVDSDLDERCVNSNKSIVNIGVRFKDKMANLQTILADKCNKSYPINNTKKVKNRWLRLIKEYEEKGHDEFVFRHSKK